mmetsp:Transcript_56519/g.115686  ORF Transcript_56519/g.115686 Transcript_56519/m.115686 type:complete len:216 (-) Transcript_56519:246-893(-)
MSTAMCPNRSRHLCNLGCASGAGGGAATASLATSCAPAIWRPWSSSPSRGWTVGAAIPTRTLGHSLASAMSQTTRRAAPASCCRVAVQWYTWRKTRRRWSLRTATVSAPTRTTPCHVPSTETASFTSWCSAANKSWKTTATWTRMTWPSPSVQLVQVCSLIFTAPPSRRQFFLWTAPETVTLTWARAVPVVSSWSWPRWPSAASEPPGWTRKMLG